LEGPSIDTTWSYIQHRDYRCEMRYLVSEMFVQRSPVHIFNLLKSLRWLTDLTTYPLTLES
jgi:hypothetical protein